MPPLALDGDTLDVWLRDMAALCLSCNRPLFYLVKVGSFISPCVSCNNFVRA